MRHDNTVIVILGKKGSGKTVLTYELIDDSWPRVVVLDPMGEYLTGFEVVWGLQEGSEYLVSHANKPKFRVSIQGLDPWECVRLLPIVWEIRDTLLVVEEAGLLCTPYELPSELSNLVLRGRHRNISQIYTSQRPATLHRHITSQADLIVVFKMHEPRDITYLSAIIGKEEADSLKDLDDYEIRVYGDLRKAPVALLARLP